jgi:hypothetical protein
MRSWIRRFAAALVLAGLAAGCGGKTSVNVGESPKDKKDEGQPKTPDKPPPVPKPGPDQTKPPG